MRKEAKRSFQPIFPVSEEVIQADKYHHHHHSSWNISEESFGVVDQSAGSDSSSIDSSKENSSSSLSFSSSTSSSDLMEDATSSSSTSSSSSSSSNGPLYQLSDLMAQLPIKRGLSKHYQGKSQSFKSLASVESLEDLAKRENPYSRKRIKSCKSYCGGFEGQRFCSPKATISKKTSSRGSFSSSALKRSSNNHFMASCRPPAIPVQKDF